MWHEERLLVDGELVAAEGGRTFPTINPAPQEVLGTAADATVGDAERAISAYNYPNQLNLAKLAPALAAGCTVVLKGAPDAPWLALALGKLIAEETDIPPGVVNVLASSEVAVGEALTTNPLVDMITFTG